MMTDTPGDGSSRSDETLPAFRPVCASVGMGVSDRGVDHLGPLVMTTPCRRLAVSQATNSMIMLGSDRPRARW
jgi:hypothetical protein